MTNIITLFQQCAATVDVVVGGAGEEKEHCLIITVGLLLT